VKPVALTIAGTDPLAGAGVVADCLVFIDHGVAPTAVETATIDQDSCGVYEIQTTDAALLRRRIRRTVNDTGVDCWKVGVIGAADIAAAISEAIAEHRPRFLVIDTVLSAGGSSGAAAAPLGVGDLVDAYLTIAAAAAAAGTVCLITPNVAELAALLNVTERANNPAQLSVQAHALHVLSGVAVLAKGGHLREERGTDILVRAGGAVSLPPAWGGDEDIHGTGCHLSAAIIAGAANKGCLDAVVIEAARTYVATRSTERLGAGRSQFSHVQR
jgi:hydroxymethylpyrimidine/phosphomethylpyrimidine kinase